MPEDREAQHKSRLEATAAEIDRRVAMGDTVVEVGARPWDVTKRIRTDDLDYHALELVGENETVSVSGREVQVHAVSADQDRWPFDDGSVDAVIMGAVIEHFIDPLSAMREARRVLTDRGWLVVTTLNAARLIQRARVIMGQSPFDDYPRDGTMYHRHNREWTPSELVAFTEDCGFTVVNLQTQTLNRSGVLGTVYERVAGIRSAWNDNILLVAQTAPKSDGPITGYRATLLQDDTTETTE